MVLHTTLCMVNLIIIEKAKTSKKDVNGGTEDIAEKVENVVMNT